jgi:hypothetical protein
MVTFDQKIGELVVGLARRRMGSKIEMDTGLLTKETLYLTVYKTVNNKPKSLREAISETTLMEVSDINVLIDAIQAKLERQV